MSTPASLELLDVAARGMDAERFLWIRGLADPQLPRLARIDLLDDLAQADELLHAVSREGTVAASLRTVPTADDGGCCALDVHSATDPGEPVLGDLITLATQQARARGLAHVRCGATEGRPHLTALVERHGFVEHERWRRFHVDLADVDIDVPVPDGLHVATLRDRPDLLDATDALRREAFADLPGDVWAELPDAAGWLRELDSSPTLGRQLVLVLHDDEERVLAHVELKRLAADSDDAWVEFLAVARTARRRGHARLLKQHAAAHARSLGMRRLQTINHVDNVAVCRLNEQLDWSENAPRIQLTRALD